MALRYNEGGQCDVPALPSRTQYLQAAAGAGHTVLLRSDGEAVAFGDNDGGQCDVPALPPGTQYVQATAGACHTVLLRSDGQAVAFGLNDDGRCVVPALPPNAGVARAVRGDVPQFGSTRVIRWSPAAHGLFPGTSHGLVRATLLVHARLALVPKHLLLEFILPFAVPHVLVHAALVLGAERPFA